MYGAAAYNLWKSDPDNVHEGMEAYYEGSIQVLLPQELSASSSEESDPRGRSYTGSRRKKRGENIRQKKFDMLDEMSFGLMHAFRVTPEEVAAKYQKQREEEELKERDASRKKVLEWMGTYQVLHPEKSH
jgi:hypothetical protein